MTPLWLIVAGMVIGVVFTLNIAQWFRLRNQQAYYEGQLAQQEKKHEERIKSIGQQLRNVPKRESDRKRLLE